MKFIEKYKIPLIVVIVCVFLFLLCVITRLYMLRPQRLSQDELVASAIPAEAPFEAGQAQLEGFSEAIEFEETKVFFDTTWLFIGVSVLISLVSLTAAFVLWQRQQKLEVRLETSVVQRDSLRKEHLKHLQVMVEGYFKERGIYPSEEEFEAVRSRKFPFILDPLEGQAREEGGRYSYYYTRRSPVAGEDNPRYYRLWCFVEEKEVQGATEGKFVLELSD